MPIKHEGKQSDRFPLRLMDLSGTADITLWDTVGKEFAHHVPGQIVFLEGIITTDTKREGGKDRFFVSLSKARNCKIHTGASNLYFLYFFFSKTCCSQHTFGPFELSFCLSTYKIV